MQDWMPFQDIGQNKVFMKDGTFLKILEVEPINFELKSEFEREAILESYKRFLKSCNFDMQIVMQSQITDVSKHFLRVKRLREEEDCLKEMAEDYIRFVQEVTSSKRNVSRKFYLVIKGDNHIEENVSKVREGLAACGNFVQECTTDKIIFIMKNCFNRRLRGLERIKI